jgi:hypothetical protein
MPDYYATKGLSLLPSPDQPLLPEEEINSARIDGDAATRLASILCQLDELRRLNKRIELDNLGLSARNRELQAKMARLEAQLANLVIRNRDLAFTSEALQARVGSRRYRVIDRVYGIAQRVPLLTRVSKSLVLAGWRAAKRLRSRLAG